MDKGRCPPPGRDGQRGRERYLPCVLCREGKAQQERSAVGAAGQGMRGEVCRPVQADAKHQALLPRRSAAPGPCAGKPRPEGPAQASTLGQRPRHTGVPSATPSALPRAGGRPGLGEALGGKQLLAHVSPGTGRGRGGRSTPDCCVRLCPQMAEQGSRPGPR